MLEGGSAERKAAELVSQGDPSDRAWAAGAEGERRVAAALTGLGPPWTVLHDRLLRPGLSQANLDHLLVGPAGVFLVDAKNLAGRVNEWDGGLFQHVTDESGRARHRSLASELAKVHGMATHLAGVLCRPVVPVLCLAGAQAVRFGEPRVVRGVWVVPLPALVSWLGGRPFTVEAASLPSVVTQVMTEFPSTTTDPELLAAIGADTRVRHAERPRSAAAGRRPVRGRRGRAAAGVPLRQPPARTRRRNRPSTPPGAPVTARFWAVVAAVVMLALAGVLLVGAAELPAAVAKVLGSSGGTRPSTASGQALDCASVPASKLSALLGRRVQPVAAARGCSWGIRLDDPSTTVLTVRIGESVTAYHPLMQESLRQHRVVYGAGYAAGGRTTTLYVAAAQPIGAGGSRVAARSAIQVEVGSAAMRVSDERGREVARAVAAMVNAASLTSD